MELGVIGLDRNGIYAVERLLQKTAHNIIVYDPDDRPCPHGVEVCKTAAEICERAGVVFLFLADPMELGALIRGVTPFVQQSQIFVDFTETSPAMAQHISAQIRSLGAFYIDCAIFGMHGFDGSFILFAGGNAGAFQSAWPFIHCFAPECRYLGLSGRGRVGKVLCGSLVSKLHEAMEDTAELADALHINGQEFLASLGRLEEIAKPLAKLRGEQPALGRMALVHDVALAEQMQALAQKNKE